MRCVAEQDMETAVRDDIVKFPVTEEDMGSGAIFCPLYVPKKGAVNHIHQKTNLL